MPVILLQRVQIALLIVLVAFMNPLGFDVQTTMENATSEPPVTHFEMSSLQNDTTRPEIAAWNISEEAYLGENFEAWAQVSDPGSGVRNVSLVVENVTHIAREHLLLSNGSHYVSQISALALNVTYDLFIRAFDNSNNTATSFTREVDLLIIPGSDIDVWITMPLVVVSSGALMLVVILAARIVDKRKE